MTVADDILEEVHRESRLTAAEIAVESLVVAHSRKGSIRIVDI